MNLYLLSQTVNNEYDTYDSCVVAAENEEDAKTIHPDGAAFPTKSHWRQQTWLKNLADVNVEFIGTAKEGAERGVVLASFNAG